MNLVEKAYSDLFEGKKLNRVAKTVYSGKFKSYNANIKYNWRSVIVSMAKEWFQISDEIKIGLIQVLLVKVFKSKRKTTNMDLYSSFIKNLPKFTEPEKINPDLKKSFDRMNKTYFYDFLDVPNLVWGQESFTKLGSYEYLSNTIIISTVLKEETELLDFVMYHEMLHKKLSYKVKNNRDMYHTSEFRKREKEFYVEGIDKRLQAFIRKKKLSRAFRFF